MPGDVSRADSLEQSPAGPPGLAELASREKLGATRGEGEPSSQSEQQQRLSSSRQRMDDRLRPIPKC